LPHSAERGKKFGKFTNERGGEVQPAYTSSISFENPYRSILQPDINVQQ